MENLLFVNVPIAICVIAIYSVTKIFVREFVAFHKRVKWDIEIMESLERKHFYEGEF